MIKNLRKIILNYILNPFTIIVKDIYNKQISKIFYFNIYHNNITISVSLPIIILLES
jgi:hypothetical protein